MKERKKEKIEKAKWKYDCKITWRKGI